MKFFRRHWAIISVHVLLSSKGANASMGLAFGAVMKYCFRLSGLTCPNCAAKIEQSASSLEGVLSASVHLLQQSLMIESQEGVTIHQTQVEELVHRFEPDVTVEILEEKGTREDESSQEKRFLRRMLFGGILFLLALANASFGAQEYAFWGYIIAYLVLGFDVLKRAVQNCIRGSIFDENFLMSVSTIGAFGIGEYPEGCAVMLFYLIGEYFQARAVQQSKKSIASLLAIRPKNALLLRDGKEYPVNAEDVALGEILLIKPGERIPLDGEVLAGASTLDTQALTGESLPRSIGVGDAALSGCINLTGLLQIRVTKAYQDSTVARILSLVENAASKKAPTENFMTTFARWYTPIVVLCAVFLALIPPLLFAAPWQEWIRRACVFLIVSCPCALVLSIPLTFFGGIGAASRRGVLVKGSNFLEGLSKLHTIVFDKTGTLTRGTFTVTDVLPVAGGSKEDLLRYAGKALRNSTHPVAQSVAKIASVSEQESALYQEVPGKGVLCEMSGERICAGNMRLMEQEGIVAPPCALPGTKVYVAVQKQYLGVIVVADTVRKDALATMHALRKLGVQKLCMLSGDAKSIAQNVSTYLGLDAFRAELLPHEKVSALEVFEGELPPQKKLAYVGDGINDAPVLARADIGIAMGGLGTDAAIEAADVVLMTDEPSKLVDAVLIARNTKRIVWQNISFALFVKILFLILGAAGLLGLWAAVFGDVGVTLLCVLNCLRLLHPSAETPLEEANDKGEKTA